MASAGRLRVLGYILAFILSLCIVPYPVRSFLHSCAPPRRCFHHYTRRHLVARRAGRTCSTTGSSVSTQAREGGVWEAAAEDMSGIRDLQSLQVGERLKGIVVDELDGTTGKKAWVRVGVTRKAKEGKLAYVDGMLRLNKEKGLKPKKVAIDRPVTVYVKEIIAAEGRLEVSLRAPKVQKTRAELESLRPLTDLVVGQELEGDIINVTQFAAFVSCGIGRPTRRIGPDGQPALLEEEHGFLAKDDLLEDMALSEQLVKSQDIRRVIGKGDRLKVYVKDVLPGNGRFHVTLDETITPDKVRKLKRYVERQKAKFYHRKEAADLEVGEEILGDILKVFDYGFFVDVGAKTNGLVHISSISEVENRYIESLRNFAKVGDKMYVRVNGLNDQGRLSLAYVQRERDRPTPPNRRERRKTMGGKEGGAEGNSNSPAGNRNVVDDFDNGGFLADLSSGGGNRNNFSGDEDDDDFLHDDFDM